MVDIAHVLIHYDDRKAAQLADSPARPAVLLLKVGDFYEAFGEDARLVAEASGRAIQNVRGRANCGIPYWQLGETRVLLLACGASYVTVLEYPL